MDTVSLDKKGLRKLESLLHRFEVLNEELLGGESDYAKEIRREIDEVRACIRASKKAKQRGH